MRKLIVFNNISLDGYFCDRHGDMSWAHSGDPEWIDWTSANASRGGELVFGRVTYDQMFSFWPTEQAKQAMPLVAKGMNEAKKIVFSRTMKAATWNNTRLFGEDIVGAMRRIKAEPGPDLVLMGSGSVVSEMAGAGLVDVFQLVLHPVALGGGRTLFEGLKQKIALELKDERRFKNGNLVLSYCAR